MSTLNELKEWIEQGGQIRRQCAKDIVFEIDCENGLRTPEGGVMTVQSMFATDWEKVGDNARWKPAEDEYYYFVSDEYVGSIGKYAWHNDDTDNNLYKAYNCFNTRRKAEHARDLLVAERELRSLSDGGQHMIVFIDGVFVSGTVPENGIRVINGFSSAVKVERAIKRLGEDKLKLIFGVK